MSFITASSYLRGPGFAGMREVMRQTFDEMWIIDLEGDNLGARKTDNVFAIQTPVAIAIGVRYAEPQAKTPARVYFTRVDGTEEEKLATLAGIRRFEDLPWRSCATGWTDSFLPTIDDTVYGSWPRLTDLFPWQVGGCQFKRKWTIGESVEVLTERWKRLLSASSPELRKKLYKETRDRKIGKQYKSWEDETLLPPIVNLSANTPPPTPIRYAYRSFDRQWALLDNRLCDFPRPSLVRSHSDRQLYLISLLTGVLGEGPPAVTAALIPDLDSFSNSSGGKHVIPLWRDAAATRPNITDGVLEAIATVVKNPISPEDFFAYCYAILATPRYVKEFWNELENPGPRVPITKDAELFGEVVAVGRRLVWLHTYGDRFVPPGKKAGKIPTGKVRCRVGTPTATADYPNEFSYDAATQELKVGGGVFEKVREEVWNFSISGFQVVKSWLGYRMKDRSGKKSSPLDDIRPSTWEFDGELLVLLWVLDATVELYPELSSLLGRVLESELFLAADFPPPTEIEKSAPVKVAEQLPLFQDK